MKLSANSIKTLIDLLLELGLENLPCKITKIKNVWYWHEIN